MDWDNILYKKSQIFKKKQKGVLLKNNIHFPTAGNSTDNSSEDAKHNNQQYPHK